MEILQREFADRQSLIAYVKDLAPWAEGGASNITGGNHAAQNALSAIDAVEYGRTRNFGNGHITRLSPYLHHGTLDLNTVRNHALRAVENPKDITKFIQELAWRDFWQRVAKAHPDYLWTDVEDYKTGFNADDYADILAPDIADGKTGVACLDAFINELLTTGYIHNHARMYIASYVVHFRRIKWQAGADWFLQHLLDGDEASNNLSWQWVASTFSNKPYIFNLENVQKYFGDLVDTDPLNNAILDASYDELSARHFPNRDVNHD